MNLAQYFNFLINVQQIATASTITLIFLLIYVETKPAPKTSLTLDYVSRSKTLEKEAENNLDITMTAGITISILTTLSYFYNAIGGFLLFGAAIILTIFFILKIRREKQNENNTKTKNDN